MIRVGIVGIGGYTGLELAKIILAHPQFSLTYVANTQGGGTLGDLHPSLSGLSSLVVEQADAKSVANSCDLVFLALPHQAAMGFVKELAHTPLKIVDLSADYRLSQENYEANYCVHTDPEGLKEAVYGLSELCADSIKNARLVANPGCYPTATLLALAPFAPYIDASAPVFVDAKSGVSGAGKKLSDTTHFVNVHDNIFPYNPIKHRHAIEISETAQRLFGVQFHLTFIPHMIPITRGMLSNVYATLREDIDAQAILRAFYAKSRFVRVRGEPPHIKNVAGSHFCDLFATTNGNALFVSSAIDNLLLGASSQAVANANIMCGFAVETGLPQFAYAP